MSEYQVSDKVECEWSLLFDGNLCSHLFGDAGSGTNIRVPLASSSKTVHMPHRRLPRQYQAKTNSLTRNPFAMSVFTETLQSGTNGRVPYLWTETRA